MKSSNLTHHVREALQGEPRARFDNAHLLMCVFELHGLSLTTEQKAVIASLPNPKSVMRIADREKKRLQGATEKS